MTAYQMELEEAILEIVDAAEQVPRSDLQGMVSALAAKIARNEL